MSTSDKVRENRLRRAAHRQGLRLAKSARRDPRAIDYGGYMLIEVERNMVVSGGSPWAYCMSLDEIEAWLMDRPLRRGQ